MTDSSQIEGIQVLNRKNYACFKKYLKDSKDNSLYLSLKIYSDIYPWTLPVTITKKFLILYLKNYDYFSQQVKKLVYLYLVRYAEEQQDLALLSISTFQKGLKVGEVLVFVMKMQIQ